MNTSIAIQVLPLGVDTQKVVAIVDAVIAYIQTTKVVYQVSAFETTLEGDYETLMDIVRQVPLVAAQAGATSDMVYVKIHYQAQGEVLTIAEKTTKFQH
ncbi:thiamine-binding protein [Loigolactobacillus zhaoyuanensis]|uniref:MTH1187 family thiamine-binding protein n=1 Tax=Loigolactobacillus zhaoyuanensis TaxID=2486017 RepID=A0ABW8UEH4_9LACO|nr:thiamine-binding protein [Loigolactobacillus zhaoyuanensis]